MIKTISNSLLLIGAMAFSCQSPNAETERPAQTEFNGNMATQRISQMSWMNAPDSFAVKDNVLSISAVEGTDFFNNPEDSSVVGTAPFLYQAVEGDFVARALVQPDFSAQWNAIALMLHIDSLNWIKFAFENSDATGPSIVTVVTKGVSDDANGVILENTSMVWLALVRRDNIYAMHYSLDGETYTMSRLTAMQNASQVKVGVEAQSPVGKEATHQIHFFDVVQTTVENLRDINTN